MRVDAIVCKAYIEYKMWGCTVYGWLWRSPRACYSQVSKNTLARTTHTETGNPLFDADRRLWHGCHGDLSLPVLLKSAFKGRSFSLHTPTSRKAIIFLLEISIILSIPSNVPLNSDKHQLFLSLTFNIVQTATFPL